MKNIITIWKLQHIKWHNYNEISKLYGGNLAQSQIIVKTCKIFYEQIHYNNNTIEYIFKLTTVWLHNP